MKTVAVIAEYNPFHNGHKYHVEEAKKQSGADYVIVVMSGNFTQTGNISIYDKFTRANLATEYGVDLVIELPTIYANSSAENFAFGAVSLLNSLGIVDYISFGSETAFSKACTAIESAHTEAKGAMNRFKEEVSKQKDACTSN